MKMNQQVKEVGKKIVGLIPSKIWLPFLFKCRTGYPMDWKNPKTFNQKLQWLKVYDRKPIYTTMVDKYEAKKYVAGLIGEEYIIPTLGVWDSFDEIDFDALPEQFVLKCTHDSGGLIIVKDKAKLDKEAARKKFKIAMNRNPYDVNREWPYKNVKPRILAETYMEDSTTPVLNVYKIFTFSGEPKIIQTVQNDKQPNESIDYFTPAWERLEMRQNFPNSKVLPAKPQQLEEMLALSRKLSGGRSFLRTDFYEINGRVYFSELTFFSDSGMAKFTPQEWDERLGGWIELPTEE